MTEETLNLLGKRTIIDRDENGTTGYTIFTATSLFDSYCVAASRTEYFDFGDDCVNKIGICDINQTIPYAEWDAEIKQYLEEHASFVKIYDNGEDKTVAYACKVIFPPYLGLPNSDAVADFRVYITAMTEDKKNEVLFTQDYHISQCDANI